MRRLVDKAGELHVERIVETKFLAKLRALRRRRVVADQLAHRITDKAEHHERDHGDDQHHADSLDQSPDGKSQHSNILGKVLPGPEGSGQISKPTAYFMLAQ